MNRPIRICYMIDRLLPAGTESQLVALIRNLDPRRVEANLCLLDGEDALSKSLEPKGLPVLRLGVRSLCHPRTFGKAWKLAKFLREQKIDILQLYFPDSTYLGVPVGRLAGVPYIIRTRNNLGHWMTPGHKYLGRLFNCFVTATLANCEACRDALIADESPPPKSVVVLENGVDLSRFLEIPLFGQDANFKTVRRVGAVANLRAVKGLEGLIQAAESIGNTRSDVEFQVAGEGTHRAALEQCIADLHLGERFTLPGSIRNIPAFLSSLDVAVLCSLAEGMSNAILEYMAAGRPIVATGVGGTTELIEDGVHGLLVPPGDTAALAQAIERLLKDSKFAAQLAAAARQRARERYSRESMVQRFETFYQNLVRESTLVN